MADIDQQPRKDLAYTEAIEKLKELAKSANTCMMHTHLGTFPDNCRPMALQDVDEQGMLWFISSSESEKNNDIQSDPRVALTFQNNSNWEYLALYGTAEIHKDKNLIEKYWTDFANAWFEGMDDPRITIISIKPETGHYWDTKHGKVLSTVKAVFSAVTGAKNDDGGVDGELKI